MHFNPYFTSLIQKAESEDAEQESFNNNRKLSGDLNIQNTSAGVKRSSNELCSDKFCTAHVSEEEPDPTEAALGKVLVSFVCALTVVVVLPIFPIRHLTGQLVSLLFVWNNSF